MLKNTFLGTALRCVPGSFSFVFYNFRREEEMRKLELFCLKHTVLRDDKKLLLQWMVC